MNYLASIIGICIVAFGILYFTFLWDKKEHLILRLLGSFFFVGLLILVPKTALDNSENCEFVLTKQRESYIYGDNFSGYHWDYINPPNLNPSDDIFLFHRNVTNTYDYVCVESEYNTPFIFYEVVVWFVRIFITYVFVYLFWVFWFKKLAKSKGWL